MAPPYDSREHDDGFTLIELLVVVLIIAVLIAIAIPVFFGARRRADDRAAQSNARQALLSAKQLFQTEEVYTAATASALKEVEPSLTFVTAAQPSTGHTVVSVDPRSASVWIAAVFSNTGTCFWIRDEAVGGTGGTRFASADIDSPECTAAGSPPDGQFRTTW